MQLKSVQVIDRTTSEFSGAHELQIEFGDIRGHVDREYKCHCRLQEGYDEAALLENLQWTAGQGSKGELMPLVRDVLHDLLQHCDSGNRTFLYDFTGAQKFLARWEMKAFRDVLEKYGITKKLPLDRAIQVLQEYYVVEPIMEG